MDSHLERLRQTIASATRDMSVEELTRQPEGKWSAARSTRASLPDLHRNAEGFRTLPESGEAAGRRSHFQTESGDHRGHRAWLFSQRTEVPRPGFPRGLSAEKIVAEIGPQIVAMDQAIAQCEERYGARVKVLDHPVLGPLTARQWRKFHLAHGRHHVKQILDTERKRLAAVEPDLRRLKKSLRPEPEALMNRSVRAYCRNLAGTPALRACSFRSSSAFLASSTAFCFWAICCLYWASSLSHVAGAAQAVAGVGIERGGAQAIFALRYIQFARQQVNLALLIGNLLLPLVVHFLRVGGVVLLVVLRLRRWPRRLPAWRHWRQAPGWRLRGRWSPWHFPRR